MSNAKIDAVIFDLGRVLVAIDNSVMVEKLFEHIATDDPQLVKKTMQSRHMIDLCSGNIDLVEFHRQMSKTYQSDLSYETFEQLWCSIFSTMDGAEELVTELSGCIKLGLLSDTDAVHWNYIRNHWPWLEVIERPTLSFEVGLIKPAPEIYLKAAANVNTPPQQCLFIDDLAANVEGARAVGMNAVQFIDITQLREYLTTCGLLS